MPDQRVKPEAGNELIRYGRLLAEENFTPCIFLWAFRFKRALVVLVDGGVPV